MGAFKRIKDLSKYVTNSGGSDMADYSKGWGKTNLQLNRLRFKQIVQVTLPDLQSKLLFAQIAISVVMP